MVLIMLVKDNIDKNTQDALDISTRASELKGAANINNLSTS